MGGNYFVVTLSVKLVYLLKRCHLCSCQNGAEKLPQSECDVLQCVHLNKNVQQLSIAP